MYVPLHRFHGWCVSTDASYLDHGYLARPSDAEYPPASQERPGGVTRPHEERRHPLEGESSISSFFRSIGRTNHR